MKENKNPPYMSHCEVIPDEVDGRVEKCWWVSRLITGTHCVETSYCPLNVDITASGLWGVSQQTGTCGKSSA